MSSRGDGRTTHGKLHHRPHLARTAQFPGKEDRASEVSAQAVPATTACSTCVVPMRMAVSRPSLCRDWLHSGCCSPAMDLPRLDELLFVY